MTILDHPGIRRDVPLAPLTTYKRGGSATWFLDLDDESALEGHTIPVGLPVLVLGRGSNLVVADAGFPGLVLRPGPGLGRIAFDGDEVVAGGAASLPLLARAAAQADRGGLSWYVGIPGSVGGAVRMNAGCHGSETVDVLVEARIRHLRTGETRSAGPDDLDLSYRHSNLTDDDFVVSARFRTTPSSRTEEEASMREITRWRKESQPGGTHNAGSVFKNPDGDAAGRIIDSLGLKGLAVGGASVSEKHANFIVADDTATADDIHSLVGEVRRRVLEATGTDLVPEIRFVGFAEETP